MNIKEKIAALPDNIYIYGDALTHPLGPVADLKALADSHTALLNEMKVAVELANEELGIPIRRWSELIEEAEKL